MPCVSYVDLVLHRRCRVLLLCLLATVVFLSCTEDPPSTPDPPIPTDELEARVHFLVNQHRAGIGLATLTLQNIITQQARKHSSDIASQKLPFGHDGFEQRYDIIDQELQISGAAETIAFNYGFADPAAQVVSNWLRSDRHRLILEGKFTGTGVGVARNASGTYYFTQIFVIER